jgi:hypothetical protein
MIDVLHHLHALLDDERAKAPTLRNTELVDVLDAAAGEIEWQRKAIARLEARIARLEGLA